MGIQFTITNNSREALLSDAAEAHVKEFRQFVQISTGVGAGNVGDEAMARAFWDNLPEHYRMKVEVFLNHSRYRDSYPVRHGFFPVQEGRFTGYEWGDLPGVLACGTPVNELEGLQFPIQFLGERLAHFHDRRLPVHAVGVGVDRLYSKHARALFQKWFLPMRSWTVRTQECRESLIDLGVDPETIEVGADWAWLYSPRRDLRAWALALWGRLGIDPARQLLCVNVANLLWRGKIEFRCAMARALDELQLVDGLQIAFLSNDCRLGAMFDIAVAQELAAAMKTRAVIVPNCYWSADEILALLYHSTIALAARYHFALLAVLAGSVPVCIGHAQKMRGLARELGLPSDGVTGNFDPERLLAQTRDEMKNHAARVKHLSQASVQLAERARVNLTWLKSNR